MTKVQQLIKKVNTAIEVITANDNFTTSEPEAVAELLGTARQLLDYLGRDAK